MDIDLSALRLVEREQKIAFAEQIEIIEAAILAAYRKVPDHNEDARAEVNQRTGHVNIYAPVLDEAGETTGEREVTPENFGRIAASAAKQVITQRLREMQDESLFGEFRGKKDDMVAGVVQQGQRPGWVYLNLGQIEALMPPEEQVPTEQYVHGKRMRVLVTSVVRGARGPQVTVSRKHASLVRKLFEFEVPEVASGVVEIVSVAREAGHRTKIAVRSKEPGVNAKGACIGELGKRVRAVQAELGDEKIDIVDFDDDTARYVANALSPAKVSSAFLIAGRTPEDDVIPRVRALVPDYQLSLAIGKEGQNSRLAAKLTGTSIDIQPESILEGD